MSMNSIENLPNETFYEIFEYFDACEIFHSFSKLNYRFQKLLNSSSLLFKLKLEDSESEKIFLNNYQQILLNNKNQISSIHLSIQPSINQIVSSITFDSSFTCLESLDFFAIKNDLLISLLPKLTCLPRLFSLVIRTRSSTQNDIGVVYHSIFNLSKLKYLKYFDRECNESDVTVSLPVASNGQISSIEYLIIDHPCTFKELSAIISYTPHLRLLKFLNVASKNKDIRAFNPIVLPNLTHLYINIYDEMSFNAFEFFINKLNAKFKVLSLTTINEDVAYLDANRWENFILTKLPELEKFYFKYSVHFNEVYQTPMYLGAKDQFISSFWLQRQWILETEVESESLIYSIRPYKKRWYENDTQINSDQLSKSIRLEIDEVCPEQWTKTIFINDFINHALTVTQIHHLIIYATVTCEKLMEILRLLPEIKTLEVFSLPVLQQRSLTYEEMDFIRFLSVERQITKIYFHHMKEMEELYMLASICSYVNHLQIKCINYMHAESLTGLILTQIKSVYSYSLRLLCFRVPEAHDDMVEKLENMIDVENLRLDFVVKHVMDKICLEWN